MIHRRDTVRNIARSAIGLASVLLVVLVVEQGALGDQLYQTGFEQPTFTASSTVNGQGGFVVSVSDPSSITVSTSQPNSGSQDLLFNPSLFTNVGDIDPNAFYVGTAGVATNYDTFTTGNHLVTLEVFARLDGPSTAGGGTFNGDNVSLNLEAILGDGSYFSTYLSSDGNAYGFSTNYDANTAVTLGVYHDLKLVLNFDTGTSTYYVDGSAFGTGSFNPATTSTVLSNAQITMYSYGPPYADPTLYTGRADDFSVRAVPEPSSFVLCVIGAFGAVVTAVRRKQRAEKGSSLIVSDIR